MNWESDGAKGGGERRPLFYFLFPSPRTSFSEGCLFASGYSGREGFLLFKSTYFCIGMG